jgi:hypothetical protein
MLALRMWHEGIRIVWFLSALLMYERVADEIIA